MSILEKKVRTAEELELLKTESCFVNIIYNDGSVLVLHTTLNPKVLAKQFTYQIKSVYLIATRDLSNLWLQFFLSQNQGFMRLFEKTVLK